MPPISPQGSRAGLITTLVISVILLFVAVIMWAYASSQLTKATADLATAQRQYAKVASSSQLTADGEVGRFDSTKDKLSLPGNVTTIDIARAQIDKLTKAISGASGEFDDALKKAGDAVAAAKAEAKDAPALAADEALVAAVQKLSAALKGQKDALAAAQQARDAAAKDRDAKVKAAQDQIAKLNEDVGKQQARADAAEKAKADLEAQANARVTAAGDDAKKSQEDAGKQVAEMQTKAQAAETAAAQLQKQLDELRKKLAFRRVGTKDPIVRIADGTIVSTSGTNTVYISLGAGDHLIPGLSFEVYDKNEGVPGLGKDPLSSEQLPEGKASIEVVRIGQNNAECRVIHQQPGTTIMQGDLVMNLVYDKNTKYHFFVFGEFDADLNGVFSVGEGDVIKSLITRWGGVVDDKIGVDTDFVILGREPQVPNLTADEKNDPILLAKKNKADQDFKDYQDKINEAARYYIPIMNQNRFFYFTGHFDRAKR